MQFLSISDPQIWLLAGVSILVVYAILVILVAILNIFSLVAKKPADKVVAKIASGEQQAKPAGKASEEDKAAVATALYLYFKENESNESHVLTIVPQASAWGARLNPRL